MNTPSQRPVRESLRVIDAKSSRKLLADKLLWEPLGRWKRATPELDRLQFLKTVPFFDELSSRQLKNVSGIMFERSYEADELIFEEGQPGAALFLILDGRIAIELGRDDHTVTLAVLEAGAFFGEMALFEVAMTQAHKRSRLQHKRGVRQQARAARVLTRSGKHAPAGE